MLTSTTTSYPTKWRALEKKSLGWLLGWWLQAVHRFEFPQLSQGRQGCIFGSISSPRRDWRSLYFGVWGKGTLCESRHGLCMELRLPQLLPALATRATRTSQYDSVSLGTALLDTLRFPVRQPTYWGAYDIYRWPYWRFWPRKNLIPVGEIYNFTS